MMAAPGDLNVHHVAVIVTDIERSRMFYRELFGLSELKRPPFKSVGAWLSTGKLQIHLIQHEGSFRRNPVIDLDDLHFAFHTADFDGFLAHAEAMGFREDAAETDPMRMVVRRSGPAGFPQVYLLDPDLNIVEVNGAP